MSKIKVEKITLEKLGEIIPLIREPIEHALSADFEDKSLSDLFSDLIQETPYYTKEFAKVLATLTNKDTDEIHKEVSVGELIEVFEQISEDNNLPVLFNMLKKPLGKAVKTITEMGREKMQAEQQENQEVKEKE